jgi:hypothetical protein
MSDTPIDLNLTDKRSTRFPPFLMDRIAEFREEYNDTIRAIDAIDEDQQSLFLLESTSEAHRRLLDLGAAYWVEHGAPFGYSFAPGDLAPAPEASLSCPMCDEDDAWFFRAAVDDPDSDTPFDKIRCLSCGHTAERKTFFTQSL